MAYVDITSADTREEAWAQDKLNVAEKQNILTEGAFVDGDKTRLDELGDTDSPAFNALTLTGANTLSLGTASTNDGSLLIKNSTDANYFTLTSGETTVSYSWILPLLAAGGSNYLLNVDADGTMGYTDPSTLGGGYTNLTQFVDQTAWRLFYSNTDGDTTELALGADGTYLQSNGAAVAPTWQTPAGAGDVVGPASAVDSNLAAFNTTTGKLIKDALVAINNLMLLSGTQTVTGDKTFSGATTLGALTGLVLTDGTETMTAATFAFAANRTLTVGDYDSQWAAAALLGTDGLLAANTVDYLNTTGSVKSLTPVTGTAAGFAAGFTGANLYGGTYVVDTTGTVQLPAMLVSMNFTIITSGDIAVIVDTNAADGYLLDGVTGAEGANITNLSTSGDIVAIEYYTADDWLITSNGWTAE